MAPWPPPVSVNCEPPISTAVLVELLLVPVKVSVASPVPEASIVLL